MKHITAAYFFFSAVTAEAASFTENKSVQNRSTGRRISDAHRGYDQKTPQRTHL